MEINTGDLQFDQVIIHEVPRHTKKGVGDPFVLTDMPTAIDQVMKNRFRERIAGSLNTAGFPVVFDPASSSPVPALVLDQLSAKQKGFVDMSKALAQRLYDLQGGGNPAGLLILIEGTHGSFPALAVLKIEKEDGIQAQPSSQGGKRIFTLRQIKDLVFTKRTRVFKVGLFVQTASTLETIEARVSDEQRGEQPKTAIASYFLDYLGCRLAQNAPKMTEDFFTASESFFARFDAEKQGQYVTALVGNLKSNLPTVRPSAFAETYLEVDDRDDYLSFLAEQEAPARPFQKELSLIDNRLKRLQMSFGSGLKLTGPVEVWNDHVDVHNETDGQVYVEIRDQLTGFK